MSTREQSLSSVSTESKAQEEVERFAAYLRAEKRTNATVAAYSRALGGFLRYVGKPIEQLAKADMQAWKANLAARYCENSMIPMICAVNCYMANLAEHPELKVRAPRAVEKHKIPLTEVEVVAILREAQRPIRADGSTAFEPSLRDYMSICLMYYGGLRASEVISLRISGLDLDKKRVRVHAGKGKDYSTVNLTDEAVQAVRAYLKDGRPVSQRGCEDFLVLSEGGKPMRRNTLWGIVKRIAFRAGMEKDVHPHIFRHSMITHMAERGIPAQMIQAQSRHKSLDMVQKYTHLSEQAVRQSYDRAFGTAPEKDEPKPVKPTPTPSLYADGGPSLRERVLVRYLDGEISDEKLERLLSLMDGSQSSTKIRPVPGYM